jgi:hypothetical protein
LGVPFAVQGNGSGNIFAVLIFDVDSIPARPAANVVDFSEPLVKQMQFPRVDFVTARPTTIRTGPAAYALAFTSIMDRDRQNAILDFVPLLDLAQVDCRNLPPTAFNINSVNRE